MKKLSKYLELTNETKTDNYGNTFYRIKCIKTFTVLGEKIIKGTLGGWVDKDSTVEDSWVDKNIITKLYNN
jgi:hypothetical protein